jgi:hypothetical protein
MGATRRRRTVPNAEIFILGRAKSLVEKVLFLTLFPEKIAVIFQRSFMPHPPGTINLIAMSDELGGKETYDPTANCRTTGRGTLGRIIHLYQG